MKQRRKQQDEYTILKAIIRKCVSAAIGAFSALTAMNCWILALLTERGWCVFWVFMTVAAVVFTGYWIATPLARVKRRKRRVRR